MQIFYKNNALTVLMNFANNPHSIKSCKPDNIVL